MLDEIFCFFFFYSYFIYTIRWFVQMDGWRAKKMYTRTVKMLIKHNWTAQTDVKTPLARCARKNIVQEHFVLLKWGITKVFPSFAFSRSHMVVATVLWCLCMRVRSFVRLLWRKYVCFLLNAYIYMLTTVGWVMNGILLIIFVFKFRIAA